jgi:hypothetical protein
MTIPPQDSILAWLVVWEIHSSSLPSLASPNTQMLGIDQVVGLGLGKFNLAVHACFAFLQLDKLTNRE